MRAAYTAGVASMVSAWFIHWPVWLVRGLYEQVAEISDYFAKTGMGQKWGLLCPFPGWRLGWVPI